MTTLVTGGTGFVGEHLLRQLSDVCITTRSPDSARDRFGESVKHVIPWDPASERLQLKGLPGINAVINLMGEPIAKGRWTPAKKERIRQSRVEGTQKLVDGLIESDNLPSVFVSASAIGIYGNQGDSIISEGSPHGTGFLTDVCEQWESATTKLVKRNVRVVHLRIGIVLGPEDGALEKLVPIFKSCLGGRLGSGTQWMSWIHVQDLVGLILWALENRSVSGPVNATAPNPVRNSEFTSEIARLVNRPAFIPVPRLALRLVLGEFADSLLVSQKVMPEVALTHGFRFQFPDVRSALTDALAHTTAE